MDLHSLLIFAAAYALACAFPGPTVTALVARVLGKGARGAPSAAAAPCASSIASPAA
jgi:threonine/homoserine/homoserine lactone efflux protein